MKYFTKDILTTEVLARPSRNEDSEYLAQRRKGRKELNFRTWRA